MFAFKRLFRGGEKSVKNATSATPIPPEGRGASAVSRRDHYCGRACCVMQHTPVNRACAVLSGEQPLSRLDPLPNRNPLPHLLALYRRRIFAADHTILTLCEWRSFLRVATEDVRA